MSAESLETMKDIIDQQMYFAGKGDSDKVRNLDTDFHDLIYANCGSMTFNQILSGVHHKLKKYRSNSLKSKTRIKESVKEHEAIYKAMLERNIKEVERLMSAHLDNACKSVISSGGN